MKTSVHSGESKKENVSDHNLDSPEPGPMTGLEPFMVRRLSGRSVQLPPLVFRQAEQYYCERKTEPEHIPTRPTTLPLRTPPLIAITTTDSSRWIFYSLPVRSMRMKLLLSAPMKILASGFVTLTTTGEKPSKCTLGLLPMWYPTNQN